MPKIPSPVWADIMHRDMNKIQEILRATDPEDMDSIKNAAEAVAEIVDVYIGEGLEGKYFPDDPRHDVYG